MYGSTFKFSILCHWFVPIFSQIAHYTVLISEASWLFFKTVWATLVHLHFHINLITSIVNLFKILFRFFTGIAFNLQNNLGLVDILMVLGLLIHENFSFQHTDPAHFLLPIYQSNLFLLFSCFLKISISSYSLLV